MCRSDNMVRKQTKPFKHSFYSRDLMKYTTKLVCFFFHGNSVTNLKNLSTYLKIKEPQLSKRTTFTKFPQDGYTKKLTNSLVITYLLFHSPFFLVATWVFNLQNVSFQMTLLFEFLCTQRALKLGFFVAL